MKIETISINPETDRDAWLSMRRSDVTASVAAAIKPDLMPGAGQALFETYPQVAHNSPRGGARVAHEPKTAKSPGPKSGALYLFLLSNFGCGGRI